MKTQQKIHTSKELKQLHTDKIITDDEYNLHMDRMILEEKIINKAEDFAKLTAPIYKQLNWKWQDEIPSKQQIKEHILYGLMPSVKKESLNWTFQDEKSYQSSSGGIVVIARTYKNEGTVEIDILFDISRKAKPRHFV